MTTNTACTCNMTLIVDTETRVLKCDVINIEFMKLYVSLT